MYSEHIVQFPLNTSILEVLGTALVFNLWVFFFVENIITWGFFWLGIGACSLGKVPSRKYNDGAPDDNTEIYVLEEGAWGNFARGAVLALKQRGHKLSKVCHFHETSHLVFAILDHCKYLWNCELLPQCNWKCAVFFFFFLSFAGHCRIHGRLKRVWRMWCELVSCGRSSFSEI